MEERREYPLTVLIFADDSLTLRGLAAILAQEPATIAVPVESVAQLTQDTVADADVLLWDLGWDPVATGSGKAWKTLTELIEDGLPAIAILPDSEAAGVVRQIGVAGILPRSVRARQLHAALHAAAAGLMVTDPALTNPLRMPSPSFVLPLPEPLTPREQEVLYLLAEGLTNRAIGVRLDISENTAKFHVQAVLGKLGVGSRTEAVVQATRLGLLTL